MFPPGVRPYTSNYNHVHTLFAPVNILEKRGRVLAISGGGVHLGAVRGVFTSSFVISAAPPLFVAAPRLTKLFP